MTNTMVHIHMHSVPQEERLTAHHLTLELHRRCECLQPGRLCWPGRVTSSLASVAASLGYGPEPDLWMPLLNSLMDIHNSMESMAPVHGAPSLVRSGQAQSRKDREAQRMASV